MRTDYLLEERVYLLSHIFNFLPFIYLILIIGLFIGLTIPIYSCTMSQSIIIETCDLAYGIWLLRLIFIVAILNGISIAISLYQERDVYRSNNFWSEFNPLAKFNVVILYIFAILTIINVSTDDTSPWIAVNIIEIVVVLFSLIGLNASIPENKKKFNVFLISISLEQLILFLYDTVRITFNIVTISQSTKFKPIKTLLLIAMTYYRHSIFIYAGKKIYFPKRNVLCPRLSKLYS